MFMCVIKSPEETRKMSYHVTFSQIFINCTLEIKTAEPKRPHLLFVSGRACVLAGMKGGARVRVCQCEPLHFSCLLFPSDAPTPADRPPNLLELPYQKVLKSGLNSAICVPDRSVKRLVFIFSILKESFYYCCCG